MKYSRRKPRNSRPAGQLFSHRGQIVLEYVLLLMIGVMVAAIIVNTLFRRSEDDPGYVTQAWRNILTTIGADMADDVE